jgi:hypothetical protein
MTTTPIIRLPLIRLSAPPWDGSCRPNSCPRRATGSQRAARSAPRRLLPASHPPPSRRAGTLACRQTGPIRGHPSRVHPAHGLAATPQRQVARAELGSICTCRWSRLALPPVDTPPGACHKQTPGPLRSLALASPDCACGKFFKASSGYPHQTVDVHALKLPRADSFVNGHPRHTQCRGNLANRKRIRLSFGLGAVSIQPVI